MVKSLNIIIRILVIVAIIGIAVFVYQTCAGTPLVTKIDRTLPDVSVAPYDVVTVTRTYKAAKATVNEDGSVTMTGWYERINGKWVYTEGNFAIQPVLSPHIIQR